MELDCKVQKYEWGKPGSESVVARLMKSGGEGFEIDEASTYAELWMGTHINAPSSIRETKQLLSEYIAATPSVLGEKVIEVFNNQLPFLFKVLSINKALSMQAHPTKEHAKWLHEKYPEIYKDPNHKPEMAVALTDFEGMCGFRRPTEVRYFVEHLPELESITRSKDIKDDRDFLEKSFRAVLTCDKELMKNTIEALLARLKEVNEDDRHKLLGPLLERLNGQFPGDNGVLMIYFLNCMKLKPSEAIFIDAKEPHAYIYGDIVEIMADSDNVVRAGLTKKFVDVETLVTMLDYKGGPPEEKMCHFVSEDEYSRSFRPPINDFAIAEIKLPSTIKNYKTIRRNSASIIIIIEGFGKSNSKELKPGLVFFLSTGETFEVTEVFSEIDHILLYQGFANV